MTGHDLLRWLRELEPEFLDLPVYVPAGPGTEYDLRPADYVMLEDHEDDELSEKVILIGAT